MAYAAPISTPINFQGSSITIGDGNSLEGAPNPNNLNNVIPNVNETSGAIAVGVIGLVLVMLVKVARK